ncbi:hypothetical protein GTO91_10130 [Heliobacterium undosum]|uniref:Uncharacterized protein n=1 Tax=Heliomicrobium undosum TaxID=121734 RepID=A0A845L1G9_9FIRM|nr:hypothetical protein [Heliomicrobium undosum]MZP30063.1 hypothetical protein [Heliomicrobium undosum]
MKKPVLSDYGLSESEIPAIEKKFKDRKWVEMVITIVPLGLIYAFFNSGVIPSDKMLMMVPVGFIVGAAIAVGGKYFYNNWYVKNNPKLVALARYRADLSAYQSETAEQ